MEGIQRKYPPVQVRINSRPPGAGLKIRAKEDAVKKFETVRSLVSALISELERLENEDEAIWPWLIYLAEEIDKRLGPEAVEELYDATEDRLRKRAW